MFPIHRGRKALCSLSPTMFCYLCNEKNLCDARRKHTNAVTAEAVPAQVNRTRRQKTKHQGYGKTKQERTRQTRQDKTMQIIKISNFPNASNDGLQRLVQRLLHSGISLKPYRKRTSLKKSVRQVIRNIITFRNYKIMNCKV